MVQSVIKAVFLVVGDRQVAEFAIDYVDSLSTVPLVERHPQLREPLYSGLLQVLLPHMQYPTGFKSWDEWVDDDEDAFNRFRSAWSPYSLAASTFQRVPAWCLHCL